MTSPQTDPSPQGSPKRSLSLVMIGAVLGGLVGFLYAAGAGITLDGHDHDHGHHAAPASATGHDDHHDATVEIGSANPSLSLTITPDTVSGYNLGLETTGFRFAPENSGGGHAAGEGHAHLYVNGKKIARIYGAHHHLGHLGQGQYEIGVTLNANDHRQLVHKGNPLKVSQMVIVD